jgi:hypothetical protein
MKVNIMFRFLHKNIDQEELQELEKIKEQLGNLNFHLYEAWRIFDAYVKARKEGQTPDPRNYDANLKGHLVKAESLLKEMKIYTHQAIADEEQRRIERERLDREEKEFLEDMEQKYRFKITFWDGRANFVHVSNNEGVELGGFHMPHIMGFGHPDFKRTFEKEIVAFLVSKGVLAVGSTQLQIIYEGDSKERLNRMGIIISGNVMFTPNQTVNLNEGTPTKSITFSPHGSTGVRMVGENIRGRKEYFIIEGGYLMEKH